MERSFRTLGSFSCISTSVVFKYNELCGINEKTESIDHDVYLLAVMKYDDDMEDVELWGR